MYDGKTMGRGTLSAGAGIVRVASIKSVKQMTGSLSLLTLAHA